MILCWVCLVIFSACRTGKPVATGNFYESAKDASSLIAQLPNYDQQLQTLKGKGKAIVSEPKNTESVTIYFSSSRSKSLLTVKNGIGIEGGNMLTDGDSLLIYNKIDNFVRKISVHSGQLSRIDNLASLNILNIINFTVDEKNVEAVLQNQNNYLLNFTTGTKVYIDKKSSLIRQVRQPRSSQLPYSEIIYDGYSNLQGYMLPRRITIISADKTSKVAFLIQSLKINPELEHMEIKIPKDATIYYQ